MILQVPCVLSVFFLFHGFFCSFLRGSLQCSSARKTRSSPQVAQHQPNPTDITPIHEQITRSPSPTLPLSLSSLWIPFLPCILGFFRRRFIACSFFGSCLLNFLRSSLQCSPASDPCSSLCPKLHVHFSFCLGLFCGFCYICRDVLGRSLDVLHVLVTTWSILTITAANRCKAFEASTSQLLRRLLRSCFLFWDILSFAESILATEP